MTANHLKKELDEYLAKHPDTRFMEPLTVDMNGIIRGKRVGLSDINKAFKNGVNFCAATSILDSMGNTFEDIPYGENDGDPDAKAMAVPGSLVPVPWATRPTAQVMLELINIDGTPFPRDPRNILRRAMQPLLDMNLTPVLALELEFYLVEFDGKSFSPRYPRIPGTDLPQPGMQYEMMEDLYDVDEFLIDVDNFCEIQKIPNGAALSEFSPGQYEINLQHQSDPVLACDHAVMLKRVVKNAAQKNGLAATFMAKPFDDVAGNGMHVHISLLDADGNNVFAGSCDDGPFSDTLRHAIGGMGEIMKESMAIFAPNANSYRRHAPGTFVPASPNWGPNHRNVSMRIPLSSDINRRVEHRVAGADANPYYTVAALLAGMHHGIENRIEPEPMTPESQKVEHVVKVPNRWPLALEAFAEARVLPQYLGKDYHDLLLTCRREEEATYHAQVPMQDFEWYMRAV